MQNVEIFISYSSEDEEWALEMHAALGESGYGTLFLASHPDDGIRAGEKWEQGLYQRLRQCSCVVALCTEYWLKSPWCVAEAMIARSGGKTVFLIAAPDVVDRREFRGDSDRVDRPQVPDFLKDRQFISLVKQTKDDAFRALLRGLEGQGLNRGLYTLPERPYPGMRAFGESDAAVFFGRDEEIEEIQELLNRRRTRNAKGFILVAGASGSGKSSLVRAGVLPRLWGTKRTGNDSKTWVIPELLNGKDGIRELAVNLARAFRERGVEKSAGEIRKALRQAAGPQAVSDPDIDGLGDLLDDLRVAGDSGSRILLVLDQLEEVFATEPDSEARALLRLLLQAGADAGGALTVLATMRSDFLNEFQHFQTDAGLSHCYEQVNVDPMPRSSFGTLIEGPASLFGLAIEPGLTPRLVEDTGRDDALPLLAFTLAELFEEGQDDGKLSLKEYEKLFPEVEVVALDGTRHRFRGVSAAVKKVADDILRDEEYGGLSADDSRIRDLRRAFYSLVREGESGQLTGQPAPWTEMPESCRQVLNQFVEKRLLIRDAREGEEGEGSVRVAHEVLFRVWDVLCEWLQEWQDVLRWRRRRGSQIQDWISHGRDIEKYYLSGASLAEAQDLLERFRDLMRDHELRFVEDSLARARRESERKRRADQVSLARRLAAHAQVIVGYERPELLERGVLLAVEATRRCAELGVPSLEADQALRECLSVSARRVLALRSEADIDWQAIAAHPRASEFAYGGKDGRTWLLNLATGEAREGPRQGGPVSCAGYSPDGRWLAFGDEAGGLCLLDAREDEPQHLTQPETKAAAAVRAISFSRDSRLLAVAFHSRIAVWELDPPGAAVVLQCELQSPVVSMDFDLRGDILAAQEALGETLIWRWREQKLLTRMQPVMSANHVLHSPDGRFLAISSPMSFKAYLWDLYKQEGRELANNAAWLAFSPDGRRVGIASPEHFARVWTLPDLQCHETFRHNAEVWNLEFSPGSSHLVTWGKNQVAHVWDIGTGEEVARMVHDEHLRSARFLADGKHLLTHSGDRTLRIWNSAELREHRLLPHQVAVLGVAFGPDGRLLATNAREALGKLTPQLIDFTSYHPVEKVSLPDGSEVGGMDYAGQILAAREERSKGDVRGPRDGLVARADESSVKLFRGNTDGEPIRVLELDSRVTRTVFSPDGRYLVTASDHDTGRVWEVETGLEVARLTHDNPNVTDVDFSPDGRLIATASWDRTARLWWWRPDDLLREAASRVGRNLTDDEWRKYLPEEPYRETFPAAATPDGANGAGEEGGSTGGGP